MNAIVSYMPAIAWRQTTKGGWRGAIRDSYPAEQFCIDKIGNLIVLSIARTQTIGDSVALDLDCQSIEFAQIVARQHLGNGPTRDDRSLPVESMSALILRGRQQRIRDLCTEAMAVDPPGPLKDPTKLAPESFLAVKITRVLDGALDEYIKEVDAL